jgi:hypothetical protein
MHLKRFLRPIFVLSLGCFMAFGALGCFDTSDDPTDTDTPDEFTETTVLDVGVPTAITQNQQTINGVLTAASGITLARNYAWDAGEQAYVEDLSSYGEGWGGSIWVQYLDGGTPVEDQGLADSIHIVLDLTILHTADGGTVDAAIDSDITVTGMGSGTLTAVGTGGYSYELSYTGVPGSLNYVATWETVAPGHVTIPEGGGCPSGEILYTMTPYTMRIVYDGSATAAYTVYDGNGTPVVGGTGDITFICGLGI